MRRTHVDLFSGIGGFALACQWAEVETIAFAEIDDYASQVLKRHWPNVRNYRDVRDVPAIESVWLVSGGVPCQPASIAGKRRGTADDRWLWPQALAVVERIRPTWVLFENPTGILSLNDGLEFERICAALEGQGYEVQSLVVPACACGGNQNRSRVWLLAHIERHGRAKTQVYTSTDSQRCPIPFTAERKNGVILKPDNGGNLWCLPASESERVVGGVPRAMDRLRVLGNSIYPQVAYQLIKRMIEAEETTQ